MNIDTTITIQILRWWLRITPICLSWDDWGKQFSILKCDFGEDGTEDYDKEYSISLLHYLNVKYLHNLEIFGINIFTKFK